MRITTIINGILKIYRYMTTRIILNSNNSSSSIRSSNLSNNSNNNNDGDIIILMNATEKMSIQTSSGFVLELLRGAYIRLGSVWIINV